MLKELLVFIIVVLILATLAHFGLLSIFIDIVKAAINYMLDWLKGNGGDLLKSLGDKLWDLIQLG